MASLRDQLDPAQAGGTLRRSVAGPAHDLHRKLLPFCSALLADVRRLVVVPAGPLESLPFFVFVRTPPKPDVPLPGGRLTRPLVRDYHAALRLFPLRAPPLRQTVARDRHRCRVIG